MIANKRFIGYLRVSTDLQDNQRQKDIIKELAIKNNSTVTYISDTGISGSQLNRDGYKELLQLSNKDFDILVITEFSRLSRSDEHIVVLGNIQQILNNGLGVYIINSSKYLAPFTKLDLIELITLIVESDAAAKERIKIKERLLSGRISKIIHDPLRFSHPQPPFGYRISKDGKKHLVIEPKEAMIVHKIYTLHSKGQSTKEISRVVKMAQSSVYRILQNKIYTSIREFSGKEIDISHLLEPIVSRELFKGCRNVSNTFTQPNYTNVLKSLIRCSKCGSEMVISGRNYICSTCSNSISVKAVTTLLLHIANTVDNNEEFRKAKQREQRKATKEIKLKELSIKDLDNTLIDLDKQRRKLNREHLKGVYKPTEYKELRADILSEINTLSLQRYKIENEINNLKAFRVPKDYYKFRQRDIINSKEALKGYLLNIVSNIQIKTITLRKRVVTVTLLDGSKQTYIYLSTKRKNIESTVYKRTDTDEIVSYSDITLLENLGVSVRESKVIDLQSVQNQYTFVDNTDKEFRLTEISLPDKI